MLLKQLPVSLPGYFLLIGLLVQSCGGSSKKDESVDLARIDVDFIAMVGEEIFSCSESYSNIGVTSSQIEARYFRMYLHDPKLITENGDRVDLQLSQDQRWQRGRVALLDFDDAEGLCDTASPDTNTSLRGFAPIANYTGIEFELGLPAELNHLDAATEPAPFNETGMWWTWKGGYKFMRIDFKTATQDNFYFHLGATSCDGSIEDGFSCAFQNLPKITVENIDFEAEGIVFDVKAFLSDSDLDSDPDHAAGSNVKGCMSFANDPECFPLLEKLGLTFMSDEKASEQTVFRVNSK